MAHASHDDHAHGPPKGIVRWLTTTNHKDIGTMYLVFSLLMFFIGGVFAFVIRSELFQPGLQLVDPAFFNQMTTMHALVMVFGAVMPATVGLANWMIPMQIGAADMALPRMNLFSFWLLAFAFLLLLSTFLMPGGAPASGWTLYPPLVLQSGEAFPMAIFAIHLMGASSIMGAINVIVTIVNMRAPGMTLLKMPLFSWSWLITAYLLIAVMPVFAGAVTMLLTDYFFATSFFNAAGGGDPVLFQHVFWFFGHPEVYIMILPAFGIVSEIIPTFSRKPIFGYEAMVYAIASIAFLSFIVWAHHMFTVGMPLAGQLFFTLSTMLIAVPTGVKIFNWTATMWRGSVSFEPPMLFALAFLFLFTIGGFSGLMLAIVPADFQYHDTYFVVAHFHYVLVPGSVFGAHGGGLLLAAEVDGPHVRHDARPLAFLAVGDLRERPLLPAALPRARGHAPAHSGLCGAVRRLEHGLLDRRLRLRPLAAPVRLADREVREGRRARDGRRLGLAARARVDRAVTGSVPHLREVAGGPLTAPSRNVRLALALGVVAVAVYLTYVLLRLMERGA